MEKRFLSLLAVILAANTFALEFSRNGNELVFKTKSTLIKVSNARITEIRNIKSNVAFASADTPAPCRTAGIGSLANDRAKEMSKIHFPWGEPLLNQSLESITKTQLYRFPDEKSTLTITKGANSVTAVWKGLTDSVVSFPEDSITAIFSEDANGALTIEAEGKTADKGIFGFQFPIENINGKGKFGLANFGGLEYPASGTPTLLTFEDTSLFYEAKLMTYTLGDASMGYWFEDPHFTPYFVMFHRGTAASAFGIEINNIMPFEPHDSIACPPLKINTYDDADWLAAATPYRNFYQTIFADDIAKRNSIAWANDIAVITDSDVPSDAILDEMAKIAPPAKTILHAWNARKPNFDTKLPDYTPRESYIANVKRAHDKGFKMMCYVCALCANYKCEVWERDKLSEFVLTRKNNITNYHGNKNVFDEGLMGTLNAAVGDDQFANLKPEKLIYTDPLSKGWRDYISNAVKEMNRIAGTDANYQDTLGCTSDSGNGIVNGFAGAQGNMLLARMFRTKMPETPMASEFASEPIAFAIHWPLNYTTVWGSTEFRSSRMHRQIPLAAYIFGYRTWIPTIRMGDDFLRHVGSACSDALGGIGFYSPSQKLTMNSGFIDHLVLRSHIFAKYALKPYFPEKRFPKNVKAMYKANNGEIFSYSDDGFTQIMSDGKGRALYARVNGLSAADVPGLTLPGWPATDGSRITGLNPKQSYALFPAQDAAKPAIVLGALPDSAVIRYFYYTDNYAYIEIGGTGSLSISPSIPAKFTEIYANDTLCESRKIEGQLPMRIFLSDGTSVPPNKIRRITQSTGLAANSPQDLPELKRNYLGKTLYYLQGYNDVVLDSVVDVKTDSDTIVFLHKNDQPKYGNGHIISAFVNGKLIKSFDAHTKEGGHDQQLRRWSIPVGAYKGKRILFSIRVDNKADNNSDMPFVSQPEVKQTDIREFKESILDPNKILRPESDPRQVIVPEFPKSAYLENGSLKAGPSLSTICSTKRYPIEKDAQYILSANLASESEKTVYLGIIQYDKNLKQIYGEHINRKENATTELASDAKAGDSVIMLKDASNWKNGAFITTSPELPCYKFEGTVKEVKEDGNAWKITLAKPLKADIAKGTKAYMHLPTNTHLYLFAGKLPKTPAERGRAITFWPGAVSFQVVILAQAPVTINDAKLELYKKEPKQFPFPHFFPSCNLKWP